MTHIIDKIEYIKWRIYQLERMNVNHILDRKIKSYYKLLKMFYKKKCRPKGCLKNEIDIFYDEDLKKLMTRMNKK